MIAVLPFMGRGVPGCATPEDISGEEVCDDARRGIALRTQSCTDDVELANRRYDLAKTALVCKPGQDPKNIEYGCSSHVLARTCDEVSAFGDDFAKWLASPECAKIFGAALSQDPNNPTVNQACTNDGVGCSCRIVEGAKNEGTCIGPPGTDGTLPTCCASEGYPGKGSCTCGLIYCIAQGTEGSRSCQCSTKPIGFGTPSLGCSRLTFPEITNGVCCLSLGSQDCACTSQTSCGTEQTQVSSCESETFCSQAVGIERSRVTTCSP